MGKQISIKKIIVIIVLLLIISIACFDYFSKRCYVIEDYGCSFHYYVDGGNGTLMSNSENLNKYARLCKEDSYCEDCPENSYLITLLCGKQGSREVTFIAIPDDGYQVKEWRFNGQVVEGNKTNTYMATV